MESREALKLWLEPEGIEELSDDEMEAQGAPEEPQEDAVYIRGPHGEPMKVEVPDDD